VDTWAKRQPDKPARSEAIRRLVERGLRIGMSVGRYVASWSKAKMARPKTEELKVVDTARLTNTDWAEIRRLKTNP